MAHKDAFVRTVLSVKECADVFQTAVNGSGSRFGGAIAKMRGMDNSGYFTPREDSVFSALDDDRPSFTVGCHVPARVGGGDGRVHTLHMYVWDRRDHRDVQFYAPHGFGGGGAAEKLVRKAVEQLRARDSRAEPLGAA